jgi:hypothetical protein
VGKINVSYIPIFRFPLKKQDSELNSITIFRNLTGNIPFQSRIPVFLWTLRNRELKEDFTFNTSGGYGSR